MRYCCTEYLQMIVCVPVCVGKLYIPMCACECVCLVLEREFMSDLIDGGGSGGIAPLIEAKGSTRLLINL